MTDEILNEEPPLVPPSLYNDNGVSRIEFRSSFLFQSSCYIPKDGTESGSFGVISENEKQQRSNRENSESKARTLLQRFESSKKKKLPQHQVAYKVPLGVCGEETSHTSESWRGFRILMLRKSNATDQSTVEGDSYDRDNAFTQTQAGVSTLSSFETAFILLICPQF